MRLTGWFIALTLALAANAVGQTQVNYEPHADRPGGDYRNFDLKAPDAALCGAACLAEPQCRAFTYVNPGVQGPAARCWLKSSVPNQVANPCCISGVRTTEGTTPAPDDNANPSDLDNPA